MKPLHLQDLVNGYFVSTYKLETKVFPANDDAKVVRGIFFSRWVGIDFEHPIKSLTRRYKNVEEATIGHLAVIKEVERRN